MSKDSEITIGGEMQQFAVSSKANIGRALVSQIISWIHRFEY